MKHLFSHFFTKPLFLLSTALLLLTLAGGCNGEKSEFRSGIIDYQNKTVAWYTNKHHIGYALSLPKAKYISDSLLTTKKNIALIQRIETDAKKYEVVSVNELKDGITRVTINGQKFTALDETYIYEKDGKLVRGQQIPSDLKNIVISASKATPYPKPSSPIFWLILGFTAQILFTSRMVVQWYSSEKAKKSVVPVLFWYLSVIGSTLLLTYAIYRQDPVFILGQSAGLFVYFRNLWFIRKEKTEQD